MDSFYIDIKIVAYGEQASGKSVVLNEIRKIVENQPGARVVEMEPDGADNHAFNIKGVWSITK